MTNSESSAKRRFDELIVWYVNDALEPDERRWIEDYLREHPASRHELDWHRQLKSVNEIQRMGIPEDIGLQRLMSQVDAQHKLRRRPSSVMQRITDFFSGIGARPGYAFAAVVMLAQAVGLGVLVRELNERDRTIADIEQIRAIPSNSSTDHRATLQVTFKSDATERDIRLLLTSIQGTIVSGPRQLGDYTIAIEPGRLSDATLALKNSSIVEVVSPPGASATGEKQ